MSSVWHGLLLKVLRMMRTENRLHQNHHLPYAAGTIQMAIDEGWYSKNGSKWRIMPEQMLRYRAASFWCSTYSPELSMGMRTVEENVEDADYVDVTEQVAKEISTQANKGTISFDDAVALVPAGVDPETGEIKEPQGETSTENQASTEDDGPGY